MKHDKKLGQFSLVANRYKFTDEGKASQPLWTTAELASKVGMDKSTLGKLILSRGGLEPMMISKHGFAKKYGLQDFRKWWAKYKAEQE